MTKNAYKSWKRQPIGMS